HLSRRIGCDRRGGRQFRVKTCGIEVALPPSRFQISLRGGRTMTQRANGGSVTREQLVELLNQDLSREYQAIIAYVVYSQVLKGAQYMSIAGELEKHAKQELEHALIVAKQIDYLGGMPGVTPKPVKLSDKAEEMLRFDLDN